MDIEVDTYLSIPYLTKKKQKGAIKNFVQRTSADVHVLSSWLNTQKTSLLNT